jgi:alpha-N-arabinofuranosidase
VDTDKYGTVPVVDAVATHDEQSGEIAIFAVNRSLESKVTLAAALRGFAGLDVIEALTLSNPDHTWSATADDATSVLPRPNETAVVGDDGDLEMVLPPVSWTIVRLGR